MESVIISKLEKQDIIEAAKLIQSVHDKMVNERKDIFIPKEEDWEEYLESKLDNQDFVLLAARKEDRIVGVCTAEIKHLGDGQSTCIRDILFIDYIAVDEKCRRCKIGTKLLNEIKNIAKERKISTVELNVWGFNTGAIDFYNNNQMKQKRIVYEYLIDKEN